MSLLSAAGGSRLVVDPRVRRGSVAVHAGCIADSSLQP